MNEQAEKATKRTRRWLKVSLRTLLLAITVLCAWLGFIVNRANKQKQAVAWVRENGGRVVYDFDLNGPRGPIDDAEPKDPKWLYQWIGIDYFADVRSVDLSKKEISDLAPLAQFTDLRQLNRRAVAYDSLGL